MKKLIFTLIILSAAVCSIISQQSQGFKIGMFNCGRSNPEWIYNSTNYGRIEALGVSQFIKYTNHSDKEWPCSDCQFEGGFNDSVSQYFPEVSALMGDLKALNGNNMELLLEREKVLRPAYGQQSDYQAEMTNASTNKPGYGWTTRNGTTYQETHQYEYVEGINTGDPDNNGMWLLMNLYENREQVNHPGSGDNGNAHDHHYYLSDNKHPNAWNWYVQPRMRISTTDAFGTNKPVCRIVVVPFSGVTDTTTTLKIDLFTSDFRDKDGNYNGEYLDKFYRLGALLDMSILGSILNRNNTALSDGRSSDVTASQVDYRIYWYGQVNVWIDRVRVEDEWSFALFNDELAQEIGLQYYFEWKIKHETDTLHSVEDFFFYQDEIHYNMIPCIEKVNDLIREAEPTSGLVTLINDWWWRERDGGMIHAPDDYSHYVDKVNPPMLMVSAYPFDDVVPLPDNVSWPSVPGTSDYFSESPGTYNTHFQGHLENGHSYSGFTIPGYLPRLRKAASSVQGTNVPFHFNAQVHTWEDPSVEQHNRDALIEETNMMDYIALCYGAKQISYWWYPSFNVNGHTGYVNWGLLEPMDNSTIPAIRYDNYYGQPKWNSLITLNQRINQLGSIMFSLTFQAGYSVHLDGANHNYITDIKSIDPSLSQYNPNCFIDGSTWEDCSYERYWEMGFFTNSSSEKYFMFVNRRCVPKAGNDSGDYRVLKIKFDANDLPTYATWKITEVGNVSTNNGVTFNKSCNCYVDLGSTNGGMGWFKPGEGKLFKLAPVMRTGGTLLADESITGQSFTCEDTVWNNGYNITFNSNGNTVSFSDSATIIMSGGTFRSGTDSAGPTTNKNTFKSAVSGHKWKGLRFNDASVKIYNSKFQDIASPTGGCYAVSSIDCPLNDIRYNTFISSTDTAGGVNILYVDISSMSINSYVMYNAFTMNSSFARAVQVQGFAGLTAGVYVKANTMTSSGNATGVFLSTITGGVVKNNTITGFSTGVNTVLSSINLYGNTISNTSALSKGILATSSSSISMVPSGSQWIGGFNSITNTSGNSKNIDVSGSIFYLDGGKNTFDVTSSGSAYHLYGSMWDDGGSHAEQENNCFKLGGTQLDAPSSPNNSVTDGTNPITFDFLDYTCGATPPTGTTVVDIGNGLYDTIPTSGGAGGGFSSNRKVNKVFTLTSKALYDSIRVQLIHRNYNVVKELCYELIDDYPNSTEAVASLQTLFMASIKTDTSSGSVSALKTYYENLILNNGSNIALVKISNYLVQKCKVLLRQYSSALSGFQQIINENQYNYEGLLARWDYMATSLLMQGQGGAFRGDNEEGDERDEGDDDKSPLTKEQRKIFRETISSINEKNRNYNEARVKTLEEKTKNGDGDAEKELKLMKTLKDVVKSERPKDVFEHMRIVNNDIQKVFGSKVDNSPNSNNNNIPTVFRLSQNYPNPFNPVTKINYDLPKDSKVTLTIYDILGREVKRLVNNEIKPAGSYFVEFNAVNYASGVYFYRIEAEELNGTKHIDAKKMVLVK